MSPAKIDPSVRAVFFDAVGTLLLPAEPIADTYRAIARRHGVDLDTSAIWIRLRESFEKQERLDQQAGWRTNEEREADRWRTIVREALRESANPDACFFDLWEWYRSPTAWRLQEETGTVLQELARRGLILGMASNFDARLAPIVNAFPELAALADRCVISSQVGWRKPSSEFFQAVVEQAGCTASGILFVGDDLRNDYEGARQAGMRAILFDPAGKAGAEVRIERLFEVVR